MGLVGADWLRPANIVQCGLAPEPHGTFGRWERQTRGLSAAQDVRAVAVGETEMDSSILGVLGLAAAAILIFIFAKRGGG